MSNEKQDMNQTLSSPALVMDHGVNVYNAGGEKSTMMRRKEREREEKERETSEVDEEAGRGDQEIF
jgi:hypothetical protein